MVNCPEGKILNPKTNRCVDINGKIGKEILKSQNEKKESKSSKSPKTKVIASPKIKIKSPAKKVTSYKKLVIPKYYEDKRTSKYIELYKTITPSTVLKAEHLEALDALISDGIIIDKNLYERFIPSIIEYMKTTKPSEPRSLINYYSYQSNNAYSHKELEDAIMLAYNELMVDDIENLEKFLLDDRRKFYDGQISVSDEIHSALFHNWDSWRSDYSFSRLVNVNIKGPFGKTSAKSKKTKVDTHTQGYKKLKLPQHYEDDGTEKNIKLYATITPTTILTDKHLKAIDALINDGIKIDNNLYRRYISALIEHMKTHRPDPSSLIDSYRDYSFRFDKYSDKQIGDAILLVYNSMLSDELKDLEDLKSYYQQVTVKGDLRAIFDDWDSWHDTSIRDTVDANIKTKAVVPKKKK